MQAESPGASLFWAAAALSVFNATAAAQDLRAHYDVKDYRIDLLVDPRDQTVRGFSGIRAEVVADSLQTIVVDADSRLWVDSVHWCDGDLFAPELMRLMQLPFDRERLLIKVSLPRALDRGEIFTLIVRYAGTPLCKDSFNGFQFARTPSGEPWIVTSCQTLGAHTWWPCKASFFHPEDKHQRLLVNVTVPKGLVAVSNGNLEEERTEGDWTTFRWRNDYPLPTYCVALAIAPYRKIEAQCSLPELQAPLRLKYYVLEQDIDRARREFAVVPELLQFFTEVFGPYPFPQSKFGIAQAPIWGMEHSTVIAYGNSFPSSLKATDEDPFAARNQGYDYILVHETAHEWWGNCVTTSTWADFWLHEGFATYAEALWVEHRLGREAYLDFFRTLRRNISSRETLFRPRAPTSAQAYHTVLYDKGAYFLHMLRRLMWTEEQGDRPFFGAIKDFAIDSRFRYRNASAADFRALCERHHKSSLLKFFQAWLYGSGWPQYEVKKAVLADTRAEINVLCRSRSQFPFEWPLDIELGLADGTVRNHRVRIVEGTNSFALLAPLRIEAVRYPGFDWVLCDLRLD